MAGISVVLLTGFETMATGVAAVFVAVQVFAADFSLGALVAAKTGKFAGTGDVAATRPGVAAVLWMSASPRPFPVQGRPGRRGCPRTASVSIRAFLRISPGPVLATLNVPALSPRVHLTIPDVPFFLTLALGDEAMQQVRLWEITSERKLSEIPARYSGLEQWLEDWLSSEISVIDPGLMVIGRQVRTVFGGVIDLLCIDTVGDLVVVELKSGRTPREVTAQALDYSSWVKDLEFDEVVSIADRYLGGSGSLETGFRERFETELPGQLNQGHRALVVADSMDSSTVRIVRYLAGLGVPINVATVQHFKDANGRELLAQVYLIEPEEVRPKVRGSSARSAYRTVNQLQALADESGIGELYRRLREGVRGIFTANAYSRTVGYVRRLDNGGVRTLLLVSVVPGDGGGMIFTAHATRFKGHMNMGMEDLKALLPENMAPCDVRGWSGSSPEERESAEGLEGLFHTVEEVDAFVSGIAAPQ